MYRGSLYIKKQAIKIIMTLLNNYLEIVSPIGMEI